MPRSFTVLRTNNWRGPVVDHKPAGYDALLREASSNPVSADIIDEFAAVKAGRNGSPGLDKVAQNNSNREWYRLFVEKESWPLADNKMRELRTGVVLPSDFFSFVKYIQARPKWAGVVPVVAGKPAPLLNTDFYRLWDAVSEWESYRQQCTGLKLANGWIRHGIRIAARYQYWTLTGVENWHREPLANEAAGEPHPEAPVDAPVANAAVDEPLLDEEVVLPPPESEDRRTDEDDDASPAESPGSDGEERSLAAVGLDTLRHWQAAEADLSIYAIVANATAPSSTGFATSTDLTDLDGPSPPDPSDSSSSDGGYSRKRNGDKPAPAEVTLKRSRPSDHLVKDRSSIVREHTRSNREAVTVTNAFLLAVEEVYPDVDMQTEFATRSGRVDGIFLVNDHAMLLESKCKDVSHAIGQLLKYDYDLLLDRTWPDYCLASRRSRVCALPSRPRPRDIDFAALHGVRIWWPGESIGL
jgi:hypothetical protein